MPLTSDPEVLLPPGIRCPKVIEVPTDEAWYYDGPTRDADHLAVADLAGTVVFDDEQGRYRLERLEVVAAPPSEVNAILLHQLRIQSFVVRHVIDAVTLERDEDFPDLLGHVEAQIDADREGPIGSLDYEEWHGRWFAHVRSPWDAARAVEPRRPIRPDDFDLDLTATIYRVVEIANGNPGRAVADLLGLSRRTAANWISRARSAGAFDGPLTGESSRGEH